MSVVIAFEEAGPWRKKLTIEVPAPAVDAEAGRVIRDLGKNIRLPGFRKGKIPVSLLEKRFGEEIERQVTERLIPRYWHQAEAEKSLDVLSPPEVEDVHFERGAPMTFVAVVETRPTIEIGELGPFELPEGSVEPDEAEIRDAIQDLRRQHATWTAVDRAAATGDLVTGKAVPTEGDEESEGEPLRIEIGAEGVDEELSLALTGLRPGATTQFKRKVEGEEKEYRIEVETVEEEELPELDDALAKRLGVEDVAALNEAVVKELAARKKRALADRREKAVLEQLRQRYPLELPPGIVEREMQQMMQDYARGLASRGLDIEKAPINWEAMAEQSRPEAHNRVHTRLLLDAVAEAKNIKQDEEEFERVLASIAAQQNKSSLAVRQELSQMGRLPSLRAQLLHSQTLRFLLGEDAAEEAAEGEAVAEEAAGGEAVAEDGAGAEDEAAAEAE